MERFVTTSGVHEAADKVPTVLSQLVSSPQLSCMTMGWGIAITGYTYFALKSSRKIKIKVCKFN